MARSGLAPPNGGGYRVTTAERNGLISRLIPVRRSGTPISSCERVVRSVASNEDCRNEPHRFHKRLPAQNPHTYDLHRSANAGGSLRGRWASHMGGRAFRNIAEGTKTRDRYRPTSLLVQ